MQAGLDYVPGHRHADGKFDEADAEVIKSYLRYTIVSSYATYLPPADFAEVMVPLFTDLYGIKQRPVRWKKCYHSTSSVMAAAAVSVAWWWPFLRVAPACAAVRDR